MKNKKSVERFEVILDDDGRPTKLLLELLNLFNVEHDGTLNSVVDATQKSWLRRAGKERWNIKDQYEDKRERALNIFKDICCLDEISPEDEKYDRVVVLGALVSRMRSRFAYAIDLWKQGIRFDEIIFLVGQRPLNPKLESTEVLLDAMNKNLPIRNGWVFDGKVPKTEVDAAKMIISQADFPDTLKKVVQIMVVDTPMQRCADGSIRRPNTEDTFLKWFKEKPKPGKCLVISNQPYVGYQDSVARTNTPTVSSEALAKEEGFTIETVGPRAYNDLPLSVHLDNLARWLYQERKRRF